MLNQQGRKALEIVRARIEREPESYGQCEWGNTRPDCDTPACIAGHIIAGVETARKGYERRLAAADDPNDTEQRDDAIRDAATEALGLERAPRLFNPDWPPEWIEKAGSKVHPVALDITGPLPEEAVLVLDAVLTGELDEALEPADALYERRPRITRAPDAAADE